LADEVNYVQLLGHHDTGGSISIEQNLIRDLLKIGTLRWKFISHFGLDVRLVLPHKITRLLYINLVFSCPPISTGHGNFPPFLRIGEKAPRSDSMRNVTTE
jgi:hypothetical protein